MKSATAISMCAGAAIMFAAAPAGADWVPGDPHKMHFPQLPDLDGYDVCATFPGVVADDWQCSATGPVTDVHVWGSWAFDMPGVIESVHISIHDNIAAGVNGLNFSRPGDLLWQRDFLPGQFTIIDPDLEGDQSWYDPATGEVRVSDHRAINQINIVDIRDPFIQQQGAIYWLDVSVGVADMGQPGLYRWGWKTSQDHFMDAGAWGTLDLPGVWNPLGDPMMTGEPALDMAFVITPSPGVLALVGAAGVTALGRRRRR